MTAAVRQRMKRRRFRRETEAAFTLIELLVVCLLIAVTLSVAVPTVRDALFFDSLKTASRKIIGTVRGVREEAIRDRQSYMVYLDLAKNRIWFEKEGENDQEQPAEAVDAGVPLPGRVRIMDVWTKSGGVQAEGLVGLWISRQGAMDRTAIHLTDEHDTLTLEFSPFLGDITVVDGYAKME